MYKRNGMKKLLFLIWFVFAVTVASAQSEATVIFDRHPRKEDTKANTAVVPEEDTSTFQWDEITWDETLNLFYEPGGIAFAGGIGNIEPLLFEGNIVPYYQIGLDAINKWTVLLSPQIILRMYNTYSYPVRTPSYMPRMILAHQSSKYTRQYHDWFQYISWWHHSNGQDGNFYNYNPDSTIAGINTKSGSFSTNWIEAGVFASRAHSNRQYYAKLYGKYCYQQDTMLNGLYGRLRFNFDLKFEWNIARTLSGLNIKFFDEKETILSNVIKVGVICGNIDKYETFDIQRCILDYTISFKPAFLEDVTLFAQYYWGEDYYNIYFNRTLQMFRIGISAQNRFFVPEKKKH